jgi:kinesin family protein 6/9
MLFCQISIQYLEIYNEALYDLLDITSQPHELNIQENTKGIVSITGLKNAVVQSETQAFQLFFEV